MKTYQEFKQVDYPQIGESILNFWKENQIFEKSIAQREGEKTFTFFPPYLISKMERHIHKYFGNDVAYSEVVVSDSFSINHQLFVLKNSDTLSGYSMITRALGCKLGGCDKPSTDTISFEQFYFVTLFDSQKNIKKVRILEYTSDHGYQIANKGWLKQFEGGKKFEVGANIDGISGATISVKSVTQGVNEQIAAIAKLK